jgi:hypothetical protein
MRALYACFALAICFAPSSVEAQDLAAAEALFNKGLAEMEAKKFDTACPALAESHRIDPRAGTLFTLAECENKAGKIATAVARYEDYLRAFGRLTADQQSKQKGREKIAAEQKAALSPHVPQLTLVLPQAAPSGTVVKRGEAVLGAPSLGIALPVDPGEHVVTTQAPGGPVHEQRFTISLDEKKTVELEVEVGAAAPAAAAPSDAVGVNVDSRDTSDPGQGRRTIAFVVGGVGVAGVVVGAIMGGLTLGKKSTIDDHCDGPRCDAEGKDAADSAQTTGLVSTIGFGVGIAGLAAGTVLLLTAPKKQEASARGWTPTIALGPRGAGAGVQGAW